MSLRLNDFFFHGREKVDGSGSFQVIKAPAQRPANEKRRLVVCCDGTMQDGFKEPDMKDPINQGNPVYLKAKFMDVVPTVPSNVFNFAHLVSSQGQPKDGKTSMKQDVVYFSGVGTDNDKDFNQILEAVHQKLPKVINAIVSLGTTVFGVVQGRVLSAYLWLSMRYVAGDEIILVGFSRGAFTARSVGGMVSNLGLLKSSFIGTDASKLGTKLNTLYDQYRGVPTKNAIKTDSECQTVAEIKAIVCWDTVGALGVPKNWATDALYGAISSQPAARLDRLHDLKLNSKIKNAFHVLSLTDHKEPWILTPWERSPSNTQTKLEQCWFAGEHEDVGGGFYEDHQLPLITLAWVMDRLTPFLAFDDGHFKKQVTKMLKWYGTVLKSKTPWGEGQSHDSQANQLVSSGAFVDGLASALLGRSNRTPCWYHQPDPNSLDGFLGSYLENTNETIHRSVRVRHQSPRAASLGACNPAKLHDARAWDPTSLSGWSISETGGNNKSGKYWYYGYRARMEESEWKAGGYEQMLFDWMQGPAGKQLDYTKG